MMRSSRSFAPLLEEASKDPVKAMRVMKVGLTLVSAGLPTDRDQSTSRLILADLLALADRIIAERGGGL